MLDGTLGARVSSFGAAAVLLISRASRLRLGLNERSRALRQWRRLAIRGAANEALFSLLGLACSNVVCGIKQTNAAASLRFELLA